jgi:hypothetical protein
MVQPVDGKRCTKCLLVKPLPLFPKSKGGKHGVRGNCKDCERVRQKVYRESNKGRIKEGWADWFEKNKEYNRSRWRHYYTERTEYLKDRSKFYKKIEPHRYNTYNAKRRAAKLQATPCWLSNRHLQSIEDMYWLAGDLFKVTGEVYHVDHIVPLVGVDVCGLHVPWNLQVLPSDLNLKKGNKHAAKA